MEMKKNTQMNMHMQICMQMYKDTNKGVQVNTKMSMTINTQVHMHTDSASRFRFGMIGVGDCGVIRLGVEGLAWV